MKEKHSQADWKEDAKKRAALEAVKHVKPGYVVGLGSGSTAAYVIEEIGRIVKRESWSVVGVPSSSQAFLLAVECGIPITTLDEHPKPDVNIDGADQIDGDLNMIKGMGGASTREKIVAFASKRNIIVADETKLVKKLGVNQPVPVEVLPFAGATTLTKIREMKATPVLRVGQGKVGPVVTDNGNFIIDVWFKAIDNPRELDVSLKSIPGVVETGLFVGVADTVYLGTKSGVRKLSRQ